LKFTLQYAIRKVQENNEGLELKGVYQLPVHIVDFSPTGENVNTTKRKAETVRRWQGGWPRFKYTQDAVYGSVWSLKTNDKIKI
jgi:hypothetical protein